MPVVMEPVAAVAGEMRTSGRDRAEEVQRFFTARRELVDAQVDVLRIYSEKGTPSELVAALERLILCAQISFQEEEALLGTTRKPLDERHGETHQRLLASLSELRTVVPASDRGRLLAQLIQVDRTITAHLQDALANVETGAAEAAMPDSPLIP